MRTAVWCEVFAIGLATCTSTTEAANLNVDTVAEFVEVAVVVKPVALTVAPSSTYVLVEPPASTVDSTLATSTPPMSTALV